MINTRNRFYKAGLSATLSFCFIFSSGSSLAYESDVHYGLTKWLALKAGFFDHEAEAIARGDQRVDSGGPQAIDAVLDYGCALPDSISAKRVQHSHSPSERSIPALPAERKVVAGSTPAKAGINRILVEAKGKEALSLSMFGAALHVYQDSWSHAGIPSVFDGGKVLKCNPELAVSHPLDRGGPASHNADITFVYPDEAVQMARASYKALLIFPDIDGRKRSASSWDELEEDVRNMITARTKKQKKGWFLAKNISGSGLIEGLTLPDGPEEIPVRVKPSLLPDLKVDISNQYEVDQDVRKFFDALLSSWILNDQIDEPISVYLPLKPRGENRQLLAKLKLLKMRDHGMAAEFIHKQSMLTAHDLKKVNEFTRDASVYSHSLSITDALLPLITKGERVSPLLPYITRELTAPDGALPKAVAILRLTHLPYDTVGLVAQRTAAGWKLTNVLTAVDH